MLEMSPIPIHWKPAGRLERSQADVSVLLQDEALFHSVREARSHASHLGPLGLGKDRLRSHGGRRVTSSLVLEPGQALTSEPPPPGPDVPQEDGVPQLASSI